MGMSRASLERALRAARQAGDNDLAAAALVALRRLGAPRLPALPRGGWTFSKAPRVTAPVRPS